MRCSKQRKGKNPPTAPPLNDALLMMWQTKSLQTVGSRCEIDARFEHQNAAKQTERRAGKIQEKRLKPAWLSRFSLAGAEGLEPSARGFGDRCSTN